MDAGFAFCVGAGPLDIRLLLTDYWWLFRVHVSHRHLQGLDSRRCDCLAELQHNHCGESWKRMLGLYIDMHKFGRRRLPAHAELCTYSHADDSSAWYTDDWPVTLESNSNVMAGKANLYLWGTGDRFDSA
ncbi:MAG: hypothetical protein ACK4WH_01370 [Phycisphaerales bacterium]